jgi:predicted TPR repeat methyltransferase
MVSPLPELPEARVAADSVRAWGEADPALGGLLATGMAPARALLRWGTDLLRGGRASDAAMAFRVAAALEPEQAAAWTSLGIALARTGDDAGSVACLQKAVTLDAGQADTWMLLGMGKERLGDLAEAEQDLRVAVKLAPSPAAWKCLGALLARRDDAAGAIAAFEAHAALGEADAAVSATLGKLLYEEGRLVGSSAAYAAALDLEPANRHFRRMARRTKFLRDLLEGATVDEAMARFASASDDELTELFEAASAALSGFGLREAALRLAKRRTELWPLSASARYLLTSLVGDSPIERSPDAYVIESFDAFAETFDAHLVGVLGYDVPEKLGALVRESLQGRGSIDALDAGCGTGLCGLWLRPLARHLTGVDLSPKMLDRARDRGLYDALICEELTALLDRSTGAFDLIVAADVLIYFGDLHPLLAAATRALRPSGLLAVSFERLEGHESGRGSTEHVLRPSGRFAHSPAHVRAAAAPGLEPIASRDTTLRREGRERIAGQLLVLKRRSSSRRVARQPW